MNFVLLAHKPVSVPPTSTPVDIPSPTPLHTPEPVENLIGSSESDKVSASEDSEPSEGASPSEHDAGSEGAFNPETGEINWDCPCLGGMAHGPCGPQFREAFSCFVFSEMEPKGIDCVEKFKGMQDCFREHPDVYGEGACRAMLWIDMNRYPINLQCITEIMDDDDEEEAAALDAAGAPSEVPEGADPSAKSQRDASPQTQS
jgi:mitochondrial intermembrane space import and assembly protein 40